MAGDEVVVGVAAPGGLADLGVPGELGVEAFEGPEAVGAEREAPRRLGALAPLLHPVDVLPPHLVALVRVLHQTEDQVLRELHDETHRRRRSAPPRRCAWDLLVRVPTSRSLLRSACGGGSGAGLVPGVCFAYALAIGALHLGLVVGLCRWEAK